MRAPAARSETVTKAMRANRRTNTSPEVALRSELHRRGKRFRKDYPFVGAEIRIRIDIVFPRHQLAIFVDGCFWHGCPEHYRAPQVNQDYWLPKLQRNMERDREVSEALRAAGWSVVRVWEHETPVLAADRIIDLLLDDVADGEALPDTV